MSILDEHTRESLGGLVERFISADKPTGELDRIAAGRGYPAAVRADNGPELESLNGRARDECLTINVF